MGVAIANGCRGYYKPGTRAWVRRGSRKICIPIDMYLCRVEERLTIESVNGEEIIKIETSMIAIDGTITKYPRKFQVHGWEWTQGQQMEDTSGSGIRINA
ncbi:hypothetical protein Tco_1037549 [Tanacetum coccineum]